MKSLPRINQPRSVPRDYVTEGDVSHTILGWCRQLRRDGATITLRSSLVKWPGPDDQHYHPVAAWFFGSVLERLEICPVALVHLERAIWQAGQQRWGTFVFEGLLDQLAAQKHRTQMSNRFSYWSGRHAGAEIIEALDLVEEWWAIGDVAEWRERPLFSCSQSPF